VRRTRGAERVFLISRSRQERYGGRTHAQNAACTVPGSQRTFMRVRPSPRW
jgi:hypothetical protein